MASTVRSNIRFALQMVIGMCIGGAFVVALSLVIMACQGAERGQNPGQPACVEVENANNEPRPHPCPPVWQEFDVPTAR